MRNRLGDVGAVAVARALPSTLTRLDVRDCMIGDRGCIALAEALKKLGEAAKLKPLDKELRCRLEPNQLGTTPDGVPITVFLLRSWAEAVANPSAADRDVDSPQALMPIDLKNWYGLFLRS